MTSETNNVPFDGNPRLPYKEHIMRKVSLFIVPGERIAVRP